MTETDDKAAEIETPKSSRFWFVQLEAAAKREEKWRKEGDEVQCRFMDDRDNYQAGGQFEKRINILWANTEVQKGALFENLGNPDVRRAFPMSGRGNKIARTAALVMERALVACANRYDPDVQIENAVEDNLLPGRGQCWVDYSAQSHDYEDDNGEMQSRVSYQDVRFEHVEWKCFRHGNARSWDDVPWVARELLFTKTDLKDRWGEEIANKIPVNLVVDEDNIKIDAESKKDSTFKRAKIWEIWYKPEKIRVYVAEGYEYELERQEDPYRLEGFFPCPRPIYGVKTTSSLTPKPEFKQYSDQADELDRINTRIWKLLEKLKYCGLYDGSAEDNDKLSEIGSLADGEFLPYKNFASLQAAGGLEKAFAVRELQPIVITIQGLAQRAMELVRQIYEITGISDIMRGATDKNETATAQRIKANFGSGRMRRKKKDTDRFVKALYRIKAEIIAEHFERDQLQGMTGIPLPTAMEAQQAKMQLAQLKQIEQIAAQAQQSGQQIPNLPEIDPDQVKELESIADAVTWEEVSAVLRSDDRRNYTIDVETDSTVFEDEETEKAQRIEFMGAMTSWLERALPAIQVNPSIAQLMKELTMFSVGAFKIGRTLEEAFEDSFDQVKSAQPQPDPEAEKLKAEMAMEKQRFEMDMQIKQLDLQIKQATAQLNAEGKQADLAAKQSQSQLEMSVRQMEAKIDLISKQMELQAQAAKLALEREKAVISVETARQKAQSAA